jgi:uracil phosphoribosyltransferase
MSETNEFPNLRILDHPLIQHKLSLMRDQQTAPIQFRQLLREIGLLMGYEITRDLPLSSMDIQTPIAPMRAPTLAGPVSIISILRAGLGMAEGLRELIPSAREGHIGLYRDPETRQPKEYFVKLPEEPGRVLMVDPMLATGGSAVHAVNVVLGRGVPASEIRFLSLVTVPEGMRVFTQAHREVPVFTAALDSHLNEKAYIVPGLGDAGDRMFGTQ